VCVCVCVCVGVGVQAFTGDTLFIGSCGRPDLVGSIGYSSEHMARFMFNTLRNKICTLPDDVKVWEMWSAYHV